MVCGSVRDYRLDDALDDVAREEPVITQRGKKIPCQLNAGLVAPRCHFRMEGCCGVKECLDIVPDDLYLPTLPAWPDYALYEIIDQCLLADIMQ